MSAIRHILVGCGLALLAACASGPVTGPSDLESLDTELEVALAQGNLARAAELYRTLAARAPREQANDYLIALAALELDTAGPEIALLTLDRIEPPLSSAQSADVAAVRANAFFAAGRTIDAVRLLVDREIWLDTSESVLDNQRLIWDGLAAAPGGVPATPTGDTTVDGWLALAPLTRLTDDTEFRAALLDWQGVFGSHPAAGGILAERLAALRGDVSRPALIGLLLPQSAEGTLRVQAQAILEGFAGCHLASGDAERTDFRVYDTAQRGSADSYIAAHLDGADFIVGPLLRPDVEQIRSQAGFVPTLALNYSPGPAASVAPSQPLNASPSPPSRTTNFFEYGLSPEDEIQAIADRAIAMGHRTAVILHVASEEGRRQSRLFAEEFEARGGNIIETADYARGAGNASAAIERLLNLPESDRRMRALADRIGRDIEFVPRRRGDVDMIFMLADANDGRLLVPQLELHNANDIPTYATSMIYDPARQAADSELDGIIIADQPVLIGSNRGADETAALLAAYRTVSAGQFPRFFAFGCDAYRLVDRLRGVDAAPWPLEGATGELYLARDGQVRRRPSFAEFSQGRPMSLEPAIGFLNIR